MITRTFNVRMKTKRGHYALNPNPEEANFEITLTIDDNRIVRQLAQRAALNKSGKAKFLHGAVEISAKRTS
jgi:hypothetical protein